jgi:hypothetical protein
MHSPKLINQNFLNKYQSKITVSFYLNVICVSHHPGMEFTKVILGWNAPKLETLCNILGMPEIK